MMSVLEYATDVNKTIEEILKLCKKLDINCNTEDDMLSEDDIIVLDNEISNDNEEIWTNKAMIFNNITQLKINGFLDSIMKFLMMMTLKILTI